MTTQIVRTSDKAWVKDRRTPVEVNGRRVPGLWARERKDGTTVYEVSMRVRRGGPKVRHTLSATTKTEAIREMRDWLVDEGRDASPRTNELVRDVAADWIVHLHTRVGLKDRKMRRSLRTVKLNKSKLDNWILPAIGNLPIAEVGERDLTKLVDKMNAKGLAPSTVTGTLNIVSALMRYAKKNKLIARNPVLDVDRDDRPGAKRQTEPRYLTEKQLAQVLELVGPVFRPIIALCMFAGLRISEALGLTWEDVDLAAGTLAVKQQLGDERDLVPVKSEASEAVVPMLPALTRELKDHRARVAEGTHLAPAGSGLQRLAGKALMFTTKTGKPQSRRNALRALQHACDKAGLHGEGIERVGLHDLRHSLVAIALESSSLVGAAAVARHANPKVTAELYVGLTDDGRQAVTAQILSSGFGR